MGWDRLSNGDLLTAAEQAGFEVLLTTDQNIRYQQNFTGRKIAMVVLTGTTRWTRDRSLLQRIDAAEKHRGISRSSWIQFTLSRALDQGEG
jgi:hypothetical protein